MRVLSLFDYSGVMVRPWLEAGHECTIVDIDHPEGSAVRADGLIVVGVDVRGWSAAGTYDVAFGFPPCTHLAVSGARWWEQKGDGALDEALALVEHTLRVFREARAAVWMIENPVGRLSTCWRAPDYLFDPCDFGGYLDPPGDEYTKRTCLWASDRFRMPVPRPVPPVEGSKMHLLPPSEERARLRSVTPAGFARAVWMANDPGCMASARPRQCALWMDWTPPARKPGA